MKSWQRDFAVSRCCTFTTRRYESFQRQQFHERSASRYRTIMLAQHAGCATPQYHNFI